MMLLTVNVMMDRKRNQKRFRFVNHTKDWPVNSTAFFFITMTTVREPRCKKVFTVINQKQRSGK